jgi:hypothetical protein
VPCTIKLDDIIFGTIRDHAYDVPEVLEHQVLIAYHSNKSSAILSRCDSISIASHSGRFAIIKSLGYDLDMLESRLNSSWTYQTEVAFLTARLMLYSFALVESEDGSTSETSQIGNASEFTALAYSTAVSVLWKISSSPDEVPYWTASTISCIVYAVIVLLKVIEPLDMRNAEKIAARNSISQAYSLLESRSIIDEDHLRRVCDVIKFLSTDNRPRRCQRHEKVRSRMAANVVWEAILNAKSRFESGRLYATQLENALSDVQSSLVLPNWDQLSFQNADQIIAGWEFDLDPSFRAHR